MSFLLRFAVSAPGKVILFGEHSVVYGKPALATAINKRTSLIFETNDSDNIKLNFTSLNLVLSIPVALIQGFLSKCIVSSSTEINRSGDFDNLIHQNLLSIAIDTYNSLEDCKCLDANQRLSILPVFYTLFRLYFDNVTIGAFTINVSTDLTIGAGTGSSASYCVCLAAALFHYFRVLRADGKDEEKYRSFSLEDKVVINDCAFACEQIIHGRASGLDNFVCTFGSVVEAVSGHDKKTVFTVIKSVFRLKILLINTGIERSTAKMVKIVADVRSRNLEIIDRVLDTMAELCKTVSSILVDLKGNEATIVSHDFQALFTKLEDLITLNHGLLAGLQVSNGALDDVANTTRKYGLHSKITGAGGGGCVLTFVPPYVSEEVVQTCRNELIHKGFTVDEVVIGEEGVDIKSI